MKKTLVALAVLAASGASFAQATLTGEFAYGFWNDYNGVADTTASGLGIDTSLFNLSATEDLGGGTSVNASITMAGSNGQGGAITNDGQVLTLKTPFASFKLASNKPGNWLQGATGYGVWFGLDGRALSARSFRDSASVSVPFGAFTASATYYEPSNLIGEGTGIAGTAAQQNMTYNLAYAAGALAAQVGYVDYTNEGATDATVKSVARIAGSYDLGVAKLGAGISYATHSDSGKVTESLISVSAPLGALSLNAGFASNKVDADATSSVAALRGTRTGYMLGAQYNLSKRTYAILNYGSWEAAVNAPNRSTATALTLVHDF